jgi:hypothetical protein
MESRMRFDPASLNIDDARKRLSEVIRLEAAKTRLKKTSAPMRRSHSDQTG